MPEISTTLALATCSTDALLMDQNMLMRCKEWLKIVIIYLVIASDRCGDISWIHVDWVLILRPRTPLPIYFLSLEPFFFESPSFLLFLLFTKNTPSPTPMTKNRTRLHGVQLNRESSDGSGWHTRRTSARLQQGMIVSKDPLLVLQNSALSRI